MIVRIWRTHIDQACAGEYRDFAHSRSLPMFRMQPGFAARCSPRAKPNAP